jgi:hypothetical protein
MTLAIVHPRCAEEGEPYCNRSGITPSSARLVTLRRARTHTPTRTFLFAKDLRRQTESLHTECNDLVRGRPVRDNG